MTKIDIYRKIIALYNPKYICLEIYSESQMKLLIKMYHKMYSVDLYYFDSKYNNHFTCLKYLNDYANTIKNKDIKIMNDLVFLNLARNYNINDNNLSKLTKLQQLNLGENNNITDNSIIKLCDLICLKVGHNKKVTYRSIMMLEQLQLLEVSPSTIFKEEILINMTDLRYLYYYHKINNIEVFLKLNRKLIIYFMKEYLSYKNRVILSKHFYKSIIQ